MENRTYPKIHLFFDFIESLMNQSGKLREKAIMICGA